MAWHEGWQIVVAKPAPRDDTHWDIRREWDTSHGNEWVTIFFPAMESKEGWLPYLAMRRQEAEKFATTLLGAVKNDA